MLVTRAKLAEMKGCVKQSVIDAKLPCTQNPLDKTWYYDLDDPRVNKWVTKAKRKQREPRTKERASSSTPGVSAHIPQIEKPSQAIKPPESAKNPGGSPKNPAEYYDLDDRNTELKNKKLELDIAKSRGDLIPKKMARDYMQRVYDADTSQLRQLPDRLSGRLAGSARGSESEAAATIEIMQIMNTEIDRVLENVQRITREFRKHTQPAVFAVEMSDEIEAEE